VLFAIIFAVLFDGTRPIVEPMGEGGVEEGGIGGRGGFIGGIGFVGAGGAGGVGGSLSWNPSKDPRIGIELLKYTSTAKTAA
jgi:hypothetical protein